jgi:hypothetical protein
LIENADPPAGYIGEWPPHPKAVAVQKLREALKCAFPPTYRPPEYFGDRDGYWDFQDAVEFGLDPYHPDPVQLSYFRMLRHREAKRIRDIEKPE